MDSGVRREYETWAFYDTGVLGYTKTYLDFAIGETGVSSTLSRSFRAFLEGGAGAYGNAMKEGSRVFWSGGEKAMNAAADYARANGMTTLEMTRAGQNITELTRGLPWSEAGPM